MIPPNWVVRRFLTWAYMPKPSKLTVRMRVTEAPDPGGTTTSTDDVSTSFVPTTVRDPQHAVTAMRSHLDHVLPVLEITRKLRPEYFMPHLAVKPKR